MKSRILQTTLAAVLTATLAAPVLAGPGGPGPGGPGFGHGGPGFGSWGPGPTGGGLPDMAREVWIGSTLYFIAAGTWYLWNAPSQRYVVVEPPPAVQGNSLNTYEVIAYPARGQSPDLQARDRYECHSWAVAQSGFDPSTATRPVGSETTDRYRRAMMACLNARGYSTS